MKKFVTLCLFCTPASCLFAVQNEKTAPVDELKLETQVEELPTLQDEDLTSSPTESTDAKKARKSMMEELEAISLYETRIEAARDPELKKILEHNKNEEKEHVAMLMDWLRKNDHTQDEAFKKQPATH